MFCFCRWLEKPMRRRSVRHWEDTVRERGLSEKLSSIFSASLTPLRNQDLTSWRYAYSQRSLRFSISTLMSLLSPSAVGSVGDEESSGHTERAAGSQCLCVQPHQTGTGLWNPCTTPGEHHTAATRSHEDLPQPPAGT